MAVLVLLGAVGVLVAAATAGVGLAAALWGGGWIWPADTMQALAVAHGLLTGHPGNGLAAADAAQLPGAPLTYVTVVTVELLTIAAAAFLGVLCLRLMGPGGANRGMATRSEAASILGIRRLRRARALIRPDLYGTDPRKPGEER